MDTIERTKLEQELVNYNGIDKVCPVIDIDNYFKRFKYPPAIKTHIDKLNNTIGGFEREEIVIISGKSGSGKTTFAITLTCDFCSQRKNVLWFPFEKGGRHFISRFGSLLPKENFYMPENNQGHDVEWIEKKIIECRCKYNGLDVVFIDHLHYIVPYGQNMAVQIGKVMRELVNLSQEYKFVLFLVAHVSKIEEGRRATKDHIKDSSAIVQESDTVLMVERILEEDGDYDNDHPNRSFVYVDKNRKTGTLGHVDLEKSGDIYYETNG